MTQDAPRPRKPYHRRITVWVGALILLYTLAGFAVLPWWLERQVPGQLETRLGWEGSVEDIRFNPYTMALSIEGLNASDGEARIAGLSGLHVNVGFWASLFGPVTLQSIELDDPFVRVDRLSDNQIGLIQDWLAHNPPSQETDEEPPAESEPVPLLFEHIAIAGGQIRFRDQAASPAETFNIEPLDLTINDLATYSRPDKDNAGQDRLTAAIGDQTIEWQGRLRLAPVRSRGQLTIGGVQHDTIAHFVDDQIPYQLSGGTVSVGAQYAVSLEDKLSLDVQEGRITLTGLKARLEDDDSPLTQLDTLTVSGIGFQLPNPRLSIESVDGSGLAMNLIRQSDGVLNLLAPFTGQQETSANGSDSTNAGPEDSDGNSFQWSVDQISLADSNISWRDESLSKPANLALTNLSLSLNNLSHQLGEPVPYSVQFATPAGGSVDIDGQTTIAPFTLEAAIGVDSVALSPFTPYIRDQVPLTLTDGALSVTGNLDLDDQTPQLTGTFNGRGTLSNLALDHPDHEDTWVRWQQLAFEPIEYNIQPARLEIGTVSLTGADATIRRFADGHTSIDTLTPATSDSDDANEPADDSGSGEGFVFRIDQFRLSESQVTVTDRAVQPAFQSRVHDLSGTVSGISNVPPQEGTLSLTGRVNDQADLTIDGQLGAIDDDSTSQVTVALKNLGLPVLTPYFGRYVGYGIDSGKLALELDYQFTGTSLDASNNVVLDQLILGSPVQSEQAVNAPVKLGLALLRDTEGRIDVALPVQGDLASPEFSVGPVVMNAFTTLLVKAASSPFNALGSLADLAGFTGEELGQALFEPGSAELQVGEANKLPALASALDQRPGLILNIRAAASESLDGAALRKQAVYQRLTVTPDASLDERITALETAAREQLDEATLTARRQSATPDDADAPSPEAWHDALVGMLAEDQTLPADALTNLAGQRAKKLRRALVDEQGVNEDQVFTLAPVTNASIDASAVVVPFTLKPR